MSIALQEVAPKAPVGCEQDGDDIMTLTVQELELGLSYWAASKWDSDFHNAFYRDVAAKNARGMFDNEWWQWFLLVLGAWRATRGYSYACMTARAQPRFEVLRTTWEQTVARCLGEEIGVVEWYRVSTFPELVAQIKPVKSPVFASKFCHFLAPRIFPVVDNAAMGNSFPTYGAYYMAARNEWVTTCPSVRGELVDRLRSEIGQDLFDGFPFQTKVIELCFIGRNHGQQVL